MNRVWLPVSSPDVEKDCIVRGEGIYVYDEKGNRYLDGNSGLWNVPLGYSNQGIQNAITQQLEKTPFANPELFSTQPQVLLAESVLSILPPSMEKVYFTCTGSEATELSIKFVRKFQQLLRNDKRKEIAVFSQSYHGNFYGSMSASTYEAELRYGYGPLLNGFIELPLPYSHAKGEKREFEVEAICTQVKEIMEKNKDNLGGILIEPVLGSAGVIPLPPALIKWIGEFAANYNILVVFDEISTGLGRTGKMFAFEQYEITPDLVLLSKGLGNGYLPIGAVAVSAKICRAFRMRHEILFHLSTQNGNPICCAAALETLRQLKENNHWIVDEVKRKGDYYLNVLKASLSKYDQVYDLRGMGLMTAIELTEKNQETPLNPNKLNHVIQALKQNGILCAGNYKKSLVSCIYFFLPYIITEEEIDQVILVIEKVISAI